MALRDQIRRQRDYDLLRYGQSIRDRNEKRDRQETQRGEIISIEQGGAWVRIDSRDGGGTAFVMIDVDKAYHIANAQQAGTAVTVNHDRAYF